MSTPKEGPRLASSPVHERLMLANMTTSLSQNGRITTIPSGTKHLHPLAERLTTFVKRDDLHSRRRVMHAIHDKSVAYILFIQAAEQMEQREGGYIRIVETAPRVGGIAPAAVIELTTKPVAKKIVVKEAEAAAKIAEEEAPAVEAEATEAAKAVEAPAEETTVVEAKAPAEETADAEKAE